MNKKIFSLVGVGLLVFLLAGCESTTNDQKQAFFIETMSFSNSGEGVFISKPGRVAGSQDIVVSSQVSGRIKSIERKDGEIVSGEQLILSVADTVANYGLQVERAKSAVSRASLQKQQTQVTLDKSFTDVSTALDVAKNNYSVTQLTSEESLKKAELDFSSADAQTQNLLLQFGLEKGNLLNSMDIVLNQIDTYLGVTEDYKTMNDFYEAYIGGNDIGTRNQAEVYLVDLYELRQKISDFSSDLTGSTTLSGGVNLLLKGYDKTKQLLDTMRIVLINSIVTSSLPQAKVDAYRATVDGLLASLQGSKSAFLGYYKQVNSLLSQSNEGSLTDLTKAQAKIGYDIARITNHNAVYSAEVGVKNAETSFDSLLKNKNIQIGMANNAVQEANLAYQDALSRFNNLSVEAPIAGVIGNILVDVGQEVGPGTPLFTISNNNQQTIEVFVTAEERGYLSLQQLAKISYGGMDFTGTILSVSSVADKNTLYKVVVGFDDSVPLLGGIASVQLPVSLPFQVLPLNVITPVSENKGFIWVYTGTGIQKQSVILGRVWDSYVEIFSGITNGMDIVTNDVSYFDPSKFTLQIKK